jgi:lipopolysaccharide biosynthesis protein
MSNDVRLVCFYLPQFHPIPENDQWWGKGFTEWTNVAKAKPLFRGHYQPHVPADLGFYDLRLPEARAAQAEMAREYGIEGFCYWHYWFGGKRLLERPFNEVLKSGEPKFPFCLGWANDSWTGVWHGLSDKVLMKQTYPGKKDEEAHFFALLEAFHDERYITVDGKPVFHVYKPHELPEAKRFVDHWQSLAVRSGLKGICFIGDQTPRWNPQENGFDASVPQCPGLTFGRLRASKKKSLTLLKYFIDGHFNRYPKMLNVFSYEDYINVATHDLSGNFLQYPSVLPNWDNTPRSGANGVVLINSTPELFRIHLKKAIEQVADRTYDHRLIFVKSWNEWAEGNHLEPDLKFGMSYLEVCRDEALLK